MGQGEATQNAGGENGGAAFEGVENALNRGVGAAQGAGPLLAESGSGFSAGEAGKGIGGIDYDAIAAAFRDAYPTVAEAADSARRAFAHVPTAAEVAAALGMPHDADALTAFVESFDASTVNLPNAFIDVEYAVMVSESNNDLRSVLLPPGLTASSADVTVRERDITDYRPDSRNANRGSQRGRDMITHSFEQAGAGRSILADNDGQIIAGNHALMGAAAAGITKVIEVETDGNTLVVVKRTDLDLNGTGDAADKARVLAYADNRAGQVNLDWDADRLADDLNNGLDLDAFFRADEIELLLADNEIERAVNDEVDGDGEKSTPRLKGDKAAQVKPVLYVDEVATFEKAIRATGLNNRGQALIEICRHFLDTKGEGDGEPKTNPESGT